MLRYYALYFACMKCEGEIFDCCQLAKSFVANHEDVVMMWRYLNLIHVAGYTGLGNTYVPLFVACRLTQGTHWTNHLPPPLFARRSPPLTIHVSPLFVPSCPLYV